MTDLPHITVATLIERDNRYLLVKELSNGQTVYNQPAGHVEHGEALQAAAIRETLEETCWEVELTGLLGIYQHTSSGNGISYVRICFTARPARQRNDLSLDKDIQSIHWMTAEEIRLQASRLRSPMVLRAVEDYREGRIFPLQICR